MNPAETNLATVEREVEARSASLKKELRLFDLVLTQVVFVFGTVWVGFAATLGRSQMAFWLIAIVAFYLPLAAVVTDGDYRFASDGPGDEPAPGKGVQQAAVEGSFLYKGPGRYQPPPSYFLIRGDIESPPREAEPAHAVREARWPEANLRHF